MLADTPLGKRPLPDLVTDLPGPRARGLVERDKRVMSPSYTRPYPLVIARGAGARVEDVDGNLFLDMTAGIAVTTVGHGDPQVAAAIADQAGKFLHMSGTDFYYDAEISLAEQLAEIVPGGHPKRVFFTNSGAETIEAALKLARFHTRRQRAIAFEGAFHGRTYGALSLGGSKSLHLRGFGPFLPGIHHLPYDCERSEIERLFATTAPADEVAAIFVEPIQGEGGYRVPQPGFLPMLREVCDQHGILLVADEIQTGMGRTGRMFACEYDGVAPDLICLAKGIASGMPLGALVARADLMDWPPGSHASTFGGNPVGCRAALVTLEQIRGGLMQNARERGEQLHAGLEKIVSRVAWLRDPRGRGLMRAVDVHGPDGPSASRRNQLVEAAFYRGLLLLGCGAAGIRFCPPLCITAEEVNVCLRLLEECAK